MIAESTVQPEIFWIRKVKGNTLYLRVRWNIKKEERTDMDGESSQMWVYEEQEILHELLEDINVHLEPRIERYWKLDEGINIKRLPADVQDRINGYLLKHEAELLNIAKKSCMQK